MNPSLPDFGAQGQSPTHPELLDWLAWEFMLNDPVYVEAAQALAHRMKREGGDKLDKRLAFGLRLALVRPPTPREVELLSGLYARRLQEFTARPEAAVPLATEPLGPLPEGWDTAELAALTAVSNLILNLDECLTRG